MKVKSDLRVESENPSEQKKEEMSNILFVALQCFECSTMQVKQKKKSSNKWSCVICNQKQSVRKVFAQGYKAKELRFFVQSFNMSRKDADEEKQAVADTISEVEDEGVIDDAEVSDVRGKKRSDWSEYLDTNSSNDRRRLTVEEDGEEEDLKIVTEMPNEMFKRPKLNNSSSAKEGVKRDDNELFKPSFSRRGIKNPDIRADGSMKRKKDTEPTRVTKPASKWDAYLIDNESEHQTPSRFGGREGLMDNNVSREGLMDNNVSEWDRAIMDISSEYQIVDDEIHPEFM